jgi:hypothetical protein
MSELAERLVFLKQRLRAAYDGIGHSHGRPYVYFVYPPDHERALRRLVDEELRSDATLTFCHLDLLSIVMQSTSGQEARREELLNDPLKGAGAAGSLLRLWSRRLAEAITSSLQPGAGAGRLVVVLRGLAALHPLATPTEMMEALAEQEPRDPNSGRVVPLVLLIPGVRPAQTSREYLYPSYWRCWRRCATPRVRAGSAA